MVSYHRHNVETGGQAVISRLMAGENCALVTDAGMPGISDPGEDLVVECAALGIDVVVIPGPCALVAALAASGQPTGRFTFEGFLPMNKKNRKAHLDSLRKEERTMIFYEAPHKLCATLEDMARKRPRNLTEFLDVNGVGTMKAHRYSHEFLEVIRQYQR
jgi:16S rRNA (cytidine1402-2'-O)-methyltransferase